MKLNLIFTCAARFRTYLMAAMLLALISACGGGNGPPGAPLGPGQDTGPVIILTLTDGAGNEINSIPPGQQAVLIATVLDTALDGNGVSNVFVQFEITANPTAGSFIPADGSAVTDQSGNAVIRVVPGVSGQSGEITATATVNNVDVTDTIGFTSQ